MNDVHAVLIDDDPQDLKYAERLTAAGLRCYGIRATQHLEDLVERLVDLSDEGECDLVIADYRLDIAVNEASRVMVAYRGIQVAAWLREQRPGIPLVLITSDRWITTWRTTATDLHELFDMTILKGRLANRIRRTVVVKELNDLALGFRRIVDTKPTSWPEVYRLFNARQGELDSVAVSRLPGHFELPRWILRKLLPHPGILIDDRQAATILGIREDVFRTMTPLDSIERSRYRGPFSEICPRWWRTRLEKWLRALRRDVTASGSREIDEQDTRAFLVGSFIGRDPDEIAARCNWCGGGAVVDACHVCGQPIDPLHGIVIVGEVPYWAQRSVVCYTCIEAGRAEGHQFQPGNARIVKALMSGEYEE